MLHKYSIIAEVVVLEYRNTSGDYQRPLMTPSHKRHFSNLCYCMDRGAQNSWISKPQFIASNNGAKFPTAAYGRWW
jgi:hypothetical protein